MKPCCRQPPPDEAQRGQPPGGITLEKDSMRVLPITTIEVRAKSITRTNRRTTVSIPIPSGCGGGNLYVVPHVSLAMPEIEIAPDQRAFLDDLIADLEAEHVGEYGAVRYQDALQFLIDQYRDESGSPASEVESTQDPQSDEDRLEAMMSLLDRHDDKWAITDGEEGKYSVTLPDGGTETVRTKDDVRAMLFKHYG